MTEFINTQSAGAVKDITALRSQLYRASLEIPLVRAGDFKGHQRQYIYTRTLLQTQLIRRGRTIVPGRR